MIDLLRRAVGQPGRPDEWIREMCVNGIATQHSSLWRICACSSSFLPDYIPRLCPIVKSV